MPELKKQQDTRRTFINELVKLATDDPTITLCIPDVGFLYIEEFKNKFPSRFFNNGTTELFTIADAAGQSIGGLKPYCYSMINFIAFRPFEGVRNCISQHKANVKLLGVKGSSSYQFLGFSHNMLFDDEDLLHLKSYMECYTPQNNDEVRKVILESYKSNKAAYIRL